MILLNVVFDRAQSWWLIQLVLVVVVDVSNPSPICKVTCLSHPPLSDILLCTSLMVIILVLKEEKSLGLRILCVPFQS